MDNERSATITLGGQEYELILTMRATKEIAKRFGGLESLGAQLFNTANFEMAIDQIIWLITLLANQSIQIHNLRHPHDIRPILKEETLELLALPQDLIGYKDAIMEALVKGTGRTVESQASESGDPNALAG
jgi:hypothetical protein